MSDHVNNSPDFKNVVSDTSAAQRDLVKKTPNHAEAVHSVKEVLRSDSAGLPVSPARKDSSSFSSVAAAAGTVRTVSSLFSHTTSTHTKNKKRSNSDDKSKSEPPDGSDQNNPSETSQGNSILEYQENSNESGLDSVNSDESTEIEGSGSSESSSDESAPAVLSDIPIFADDGGDTDGSGDSNDSDDSVDSDDSESTADESEDEEEEEEPDEPEPDPEPTGEKFKDRAGVENAARFVQKSASYASMILSESDSEKVVSDAGKRAANKAVRLITSKHERAVLAKNVKNGAKRVSKTIHGIKKTAARVKHVASAVGKLFSNPVFWKAMGIAAIVIISIALVLTVSSMIMSISSTTSIKSSDEELTKTYLYVTKLDAELSKKIRGYSETDVTFTFHGLGTDPSAITIFTDIDLLLLYLDVRFGDYKLSEISDEIDAIYSKLYVLFEYTQDGQKIVMLTRKTVAAFVSSDTSLSKSDKERMNVQQDVGMYTSRWELGSPFPESTSFRVSKRFGWYLNDENNLEKRNYIELSGKSGTVKNVMDGTTSAASASSLTVTDGGDRQVTYGGLNRVSAANNTLLTRDDSVGTASGKITIAYKKNGEVVNPQFYINGIAPEGVFGGDPGSALGDGSYAALIEEAEKWLGYPYVFGGRSPSTSFDCSGYICWVYSHAGIYNFGDTHAQGLYNQCVPITEAEAQPGDLVFFKHTYKTGDGREITHVGIFISEGQMLHCGGSSVQYSSYHTKFWQSHEPTFGRVPTAG